MYLFYARNNLNSRMTLSCALDVAREPSSSSSSTSSFVYHGLPSILSVYPSLLHLQGGSSKWLLVVWYIGFDIFSENSNRGSQYYSAYHQRSSPGSSLICCYQARSAWLSAARICTIYSARCSKPRSYSSLECLECLLMINCLPYGWEPSSNLRTVAGHSALLAKNCIQRTNFQDINCGMSRHGNECVVCGQE